MIFRKKPLIAQYQIIRHAAADDAKPAANVTVEILKCTLIPGYISYRVIKGTVPLARKIYSYLKD